MRHRGSLTEELVKDSQGWFLGFVAERRKAAASSMDDIKTGRIYTGREALKIGLIDAIGDEQTAIKWFTDTRNVASGLKVKDWKPQQLRVRPFSSSLTGLAGKLGLGSLIDFERAGGVGSAEGSPA